MKDNKTSLKGKAKSLADAEFASSLIRLKERYEKYFEGLAENSIENTTLTAYMNILKLILDIDKKLSEEGQASPRELKEIAREILENEYGVRRV
jgi:hypothetical protein